MSHTPGPWGFSYDIQCDVYRVGRSGSLARIAEVQGAMDDVEANARLIATAPDLLAALKVCVGHDEARFMPGYQSALDAIAKAEGR